MREINFSELIGLWYNNSETDIINLYIRGYRPAEEKGLSFYTIIEKKSTNVRFNLEGVLSINRIEEDNYLIFEEIHSTEEDSSIYEKIKIWSFDENNMTLEFNNGSKINFTKRP